MNVTPDDVLSFWFGEPAADPAALGSKLKRWFRGGPALDAEIRERFEPAVERALAGELDAWTETPRGRLALILILDQFTRNVYRDDPRAFSGDARAQRLAVEALDAGLERGLAPFERVFLTSPLGHAEDLPLQERFVTEAQRLHDDVSGWEKSFLAMSVEQSRKYREVIARFGRFPHRNAALGRVSTPEEEAFLVGWNERQPPRPVEQATG